MSGPRVHDGKQLLPISELDSGTGAVAPVPPAEEKDGTVFVVLPSFRDGKRCAETIQSIFQNAKEPEKVHVGLIEQTSTDDDYCLDVYCKSFGSPHISKRVIRKDMTKIMVDPQRENCPHLDRIRQVSVFNVAAKGPADARALTRKILGNEEYCMQIDAHMSFTKDWDQLAKEEWRKVGNEFAIISTVPADKAAQSDYESWTGTKKGEVPRSCFIKISTDNGVPIFPSPADGKAMDLQKPLLSHSWSAAFSFAKCHLEETAPYDPFTPYVMGVEQYARFARFWTRGYDSYTPTRNIVYHDYGKSEHSMTEWMRYRRQRLRDDSLKRILNYLTEPRDEAGEIDLANLGIYGLGRRRTLQQLMDFAGIDIQSKTGNGKDTKCGNMQWVAYDTTISPMENMYTKATNLDPQPEFPLRSETVFYQDMDQTVVIPDVVDVAPEVGHQQHPAGEDAAETGPPFTILFVLWIFGLIVWCMVFVNTRNGKTTPKRRKAGGEGVKDV